MQFPKETDKREVFETFCNEYFKDNAKLRPYQEQTKNKSGIHSQLKNIKKLLVNGNRLTYNLMVLCFMIN